MDIYESMVKQCNIINFVIDSTDTVVDTNMYTMTLLDTYDITGRNLYSLLDDMSQLKIRSCLMSGYFDSMEVNFKTQNGDLKQAIIILNKVGSYTAVFGLIKRRKAESISGQLEEMNRRVQLENSNVISNYSTSSEGEKRMWQLNNIDSLTGLYNKKFFTSIYEAQYTKAVENQANPGIVIVDIDNFEQLDENFGFGKTDRVLVGLSQIILAGIRSTDYAVRYGSGEILLLLANVKDNSLSMISERIREGAESRIGVTVSIGCTSLQTSKAEGKEDLIRIASEALNISKSEGGNKATVI